MAQNKDVYSAYVCKKQGNEPCVRHVWAGHLVEAAAQEMAEIEVIEK